MKAPISWINQYTKIKLPLKELMWKLTENGLTCESYEKVNGDVVLDIEATPNRPDWLSIVGVAREVSIIQNTKLVLPNLPKISKKTANLPIQVSLDKSLVGRYAGITIESVKVKKSPKWLADKLISIGLRPINNLVDITNFVMFEFGVPIHVFDYDKFLSHKLSMILSKGGEKFTSVDGIKYSLPKNALIIKDSPKRVIDLCAIKGGENTGITQSTKNIFIHVPIYSPITTRKTSQKMKLASDASYIYERGPNTRLIPTTLFRTVALMQELAGGKIASKIIDSGEKETTKPLTIKINDFQEILGVDIDLKTIIKILDSLEFNPKQKDANLICQIPNHRSDVSIKEDLAEEVARVYGYNKFPLTLPSGKQSTKKIPFFYDRNEELHLKQLLFSAGYKEINTLSLCSKKNIESFNLDPSNHVRIENPVSLEYEYMRSSLIPSLTMALMLNADEKYLKLFEYNKIFIPPVHKSQERHQVSAIIKNGKFKEIKGLLDKILDAYNINDFTIKPFAAKKGLWHPQKAAVIEAKEDAIATIGEINPKILSGLGIQDNIQAMELDVKNLIFHKKQVNYKDVLKYPPQIEDITVKVPKNTQIKTVIDKIKSSSKYIVDVQLMDKYKNSFTFRINYQNPKKTLSDKEVKEIRKKIEKSLKKS